MGENIKLTDLELGWTCKKFCLVFGIGFFPCIICCYLAHLRKNPRIEVDNFIVPGNLCQKCRGKIRHGFIIDGECVAKVKQLYLCLGCNTVYPDYYLKKYLGPELPYNPYDRRQRRRR